MLLEAAGGCMGHSLSMCCYDHGQCFVCAALVGHCSCVQESCDCDAIAGAAGAEVPLPSYKGGCQKPQLFNQQ